MANDSGIRVDGLCFHVGSQAATANTHADALGVCLDLCEQIKDEGLPEILRIDIGGGFPAHYIGNHPTSMRFASLFVTFSSESLKILRFWQNLVV